jgi:hypothetical protein
VIVATDSHKPRSPAVHATPTVPVSSRPALPTPSAAPPALEAPPAPSLKRVVPSARLPDTDEAAPDSLAAEANSLEQARRALGADPARALALLNRAEREFPKGKLADERELLVIQALSRLGRSGEARARTAAMLGRSKGGLYQERLERMLSNMR